MALLWLSKGCSVPEAAERCGIHPAQIHRAATKDEALGRLLRLLRPSKSQPKTFSYDVNQGALEPEDSGLDDDTCDDGGEE